MTWQLKSPSFLVELRSRIRSWNPYA